MPDVQADLKVLAGRVAEQLVARALQDLAIGVPPFPMTITVSPVPPCRQLGPALVEKPRRKPGPKPKKAQPGKRADAGATGRRRCRSCKVANAAGPVSGTARTFKCGSCGFEWEGRRSKFEAEKPPARRPNAKPVAGRCARCDHPAAKHPDFAECLEKRCVCKGFVE